MNKFPTFVFTAIALGSLIAPTGCVQQKKEPPMLVLGSGTPKKAEAPKENLNLKLLRAAHDKDLATVKKCVKSGADVNVKDVGDGGDPSGWTAAMWAVWHWFDDRPFCAYIMHSGGEFAQHQKDNLLERAARTGDYDRAKTFLELGANPNYVNVFGENCATLALRYFRGQYGIAEDDTAKPRYGDLKGINETIHANTETLTAKKKQFEEIQSAKKSYEAAVASFQKSPHAEANERETFDRAELDEARKFAEKLNVPVKADSAAGIYAELEDGAKKSVAAAEKPLKQTRFIALLKENGADMRKLLAGTQDDTGKQDKWKGQQDKWTVDPAARYGVSEKLPALTDGLEDGELALIQLIGRGDEIFREQAHDTMTPITPEYLFGLYISKDEKAAALLGMLNEMLKAVIANEMQAQAFSVGKTTRGAYTDRGIERSYTRSRTTNYTIRPQLSYEDLFSALANGAQKGVDLANLLGAIEFVKNGAAHLDLINSTVNEENAKVRERNEKLFSLFEELPLEGELAEKWKERWEIRLKYREAYAETFREKLKAQLSGFVAKRERELAQLYKQGDVNGTPEEISKKFGEIEDAIEKQESELKKIRDFLASDFFKKKSVRELLENPPNPREEAPAWYAENCLGELKSPQVFLDVAREFLDYGADVNARANVTDAPALVCSLLWDNPDFTKLLLEYGADKKLALFYICERDDFDLLAKLLPLIDDVSGVPANAAGDTILHRAVRARRADLVGELVSRGAAVDARNKHKDTPLHLAAEIESEECVRALLASGADVNARDDDGRKPFQRFWNVPNPALAQIFVDAHKTASE